MAAGADAPPGSQPTEGCDGGPRDAGAEGAESDGNTPEMREDEVLACQFSAWYDKFAAVTFKSEVLKLPEDFVAYLNADGIRFAGKARDDASSDSSCEDDAVRIEEVRDSDSESSASEAAEQSFPELEERIRASIERLGGAVLPKLNWSAPKDATWLQPGMKCYSPEEVIMLLKASDFVSHDLCHSFDHCGTSRKRPEDFTLVLRKWRELHESNEFRCFVSGSDLIAVSQRNTSGYFEHLKDPAEMEAHQQVIKDFFEDHLREAFPLARYAFDIYIGAAPKRRARLVDFSPWGPTTDACLFDWRELQELSSAAPPGGVDFRVVQSEAEIQGKAETYSQIPLELAQLNSGEGLEELIRKADKVLQEKDNKS